MGGFIAGRSTYSAMGAINALGLTTNLQLCLDAGDVNSYSGSGQSWLDLSGNGYDFFLGTDGTTQASDPTFSGSAGALSSSVYWSLDGGDLFTLDQANPTWASDIHKDNTAHSFAVWVYSKAEAAASGEVQMLLSTYPNGSVSAGFNFYLQPSNATLPGSAAFAVRKDDGNFALSPSITTTAETLHAPDDQWNFVGLSFTEGGAANWQINGDAAAESGGTTYSSPGTGSGSVLTLGASPGGAFTLDNGSRLAVVCAWSRALSATELMDLFNATRDRFA